MRESLDTFGRSICTSPAQTVGGLGADVFLLQGPLFPFSRRGDVGYCDCIPTTEEVTDAADVGPQPHPFGGGVQADGVDELGFRQSGLPLRLIQSTVPTATTSAAAIKMFNAVPSSSPHPVTSAATAVPPSRGISNGIEQQAAHAPATPRAASKGFFIVSFQSHGTFRAMNLKAQAT